MAHKILLQLIYKAFSDKARVKAVRGGKYRYSLSLRFVIFIFEAFICFFTVFMHFQDRGDLSILGLCLAVPMTVIFLYFLSWRLNVSEDGLIISRFLILRRSLQWYDFHGYSLARDSGDDTESLTLWGEEKRCFTVSSLVEGYDTFKKTVVRRGIPRRHGKAK